MEYVNFSTPLTPISLLPGLRSTAPETRTAEEAISVSLIVFIEYGELYITDGDAAYHLRENELLILKPDSTHYSHKKWRKRLNLTGFISEVWEIINTPGNSIW